MKKFVKLAITAVFVAGILICLTVVGTNIYMVRSQRDKIVTAEKTGGEYDCIIVLGAGVWADGSPTAMLEDRLKMGIDLYKQGIAPKIIMSGDHGQKNYDEVNIMKAYAIEQGVLSEDIFMDHAGFSTYETMYRARDIFQVKKAVVVTQKYHIYRALYIAEKLGIEAVGVNSDPRKYLGQGYRDFREVLARTKDFFSVIIKPKPTFLGETIPVSGNGDITNDKK